MVAAFAGARPRVVPACREQSAALVPGCPPRAVTRTLSVGSHNVINLHNVGSAAPKGAPRAPHTRSSAPGRGALAVAAAAAYPFKTRDARLVLEDGSVWKGTSFGAKGVAVGEVVFNTSITGYQEIMTDPSYKGQFVAFTHPHIGNVGINSGAFVVLYMGASILLPQGSGVCCC